jgi:hypothetical protein
LSNGSPDGTVGEPNNFRDIHLRSDLIKGPGLKVKLDVRRGWECPACGRRVQRQGDITAYQCHCQEPPVWMRLVEAQRENRPYQPYIVPEIAADELLVDEEPDPGESPTSVEAAVLEEIIPPADVEEFSLDDEFYSPEEDPDETLDETPGIVEVSIPEPVETPADEQAPSPEPEASSVQPPESAPKEQPRQGNSRRRRSGRKRSRRGGSPKGGNQGGQ